MNIFMYELNFSEAAGIIAVIIVVSAIVVGVLKFIINDIYMISRTQIREKKSPRIH